MKISSLSLVAFLVVGSLGLGSGVFACGGGGGGYGGGLGGIGGIGGGYGGSINNGNRNNCNNGGNGNNGSNYLRAYEPFHSSYFVQPGDTFYNISLKEYGSSAATNYIARYNRLATNVALAPGQQLLLPSISSNGRMTPSRAPAAVPVVTTQNAVTTTSPKLTQPLPTNTSLASTTTVAEPERTSVPTGSVLKLDGELGAEQGVVRLRVNNVAFPVEVVEWSETSTKVRLPSLDVTEVAKAEIEILRADGSLAASNPVELTAATSSLALRN